MHGVTLKIIMKTWLHNSKAVANSSQLVPCYLLLHSYHLEPNGPISRFFYRRLEGIMQLNSGKASTLEKVNPQMFSTSFSNLLQRRSQAQRRNRSKYARVKSPTHGAVSRDQI